MSTTPSKVKITKKNYLENFHHENKPLKVVVQCRAGELDVISLFFFFNEEIIHDRFEILTNTKKNST